jgi:Flp pilus assembly pilin Flp
MQTFQYSLFRFGNDQSGQDLVEYALIVAMIALFAASAMKGCGSAVDNVVLGIISKMASHF